MGIIRQKRLKTPKKEGSSLAAVCENAPFSVNSRD